LQISQKEKISTQQVPRAELVPPEENSTYKYPKKKNQHATSFMKKK